jgi:hypothetical protein
VSVNENVAARTPQPPVALEEVGRSVLEEARGGSGHAALTLTPMVGGPFKQTLVAVCDGRTLSPREWNGPASLQVLAGEAAVADRTLTAGQWAPVPADGTEIAARGDLLALLTVAPEDS